MKDVYSDFQKGTGEPIDVQAFLSALKTLSLSDMSIPLPSFLSKLLSLKEQVDGGLSAGPDGLLSDSLSEGMISGLGVGGVLGELGDDLVMQLFQVADGTINGALDKLTGVLLSNINFPEVFFLETIKGLYKTGADQNYYNKYLRNVLLKKDLLSSLKWLDGINRVTYVGYKADARVKDCIVAASNSAIRVSNYMMNQMNIARNDLKRLTLEGDSADYRDNIVEEINTSLHDIFQNLIINSYTNITVAEIANTIKTFDLKPCILGDNDTYFSKKFRISTNSINRMSPFYKFKDGGLDYISGIAEGFDKKTTKYINIRNNNIKRIFLYLNNERIFGSDRLIHPELAERLSYKTISTAMEIADNALGALTNTGIPKAILGAVNQINGSIYTFTKSVEKMLYDPSKVQYLRFADQIPMPTSASPDENDIEETMEMLIIKLRNSEGLIYPSDFETFFDIVREEYRTMEMSYLLTVLLSDVDDGTIVEADFRVMRIIEEMYNTWNDTGTSDLLILNYRLILPTILSSIQDSTYTTTYLQNNTLRFMISDVKTNLGGDYIATSNTHDTALIFIYMYNYLITYIKNIINGSVNAADIKLFEILYSEAISYIEAGNVPTFGEGSTEETRYIYEVLQASQKSIIDNDSEFSTFPNDYYALLAEAEAAIANGYKSASGMDKYLIDLRENVRNTITQVNDGSLEPSEIMTFAQLSNLAAETSGTLDKYITSNVFLSDEDLNKLEILGNTLVDLREKSDIDLLNSPIDTSNRSAPSGYTEFDSSNSEQYWANMDRIIDQDSSYFDFDVLKPSRANYNSIEKEIIEARGGKVGIVGWIRPTYTL